MVAYLLLFGISVSVPAPPLCVKKVSVQVRLGLDEPWVGNGEIKQEYDSVPAADVKRQAPTWPLSTMLTGFLTSFGRVDPDISQYVYWLVSETCSF